MKNFSIALFVLLFIAFPGKVLASLDLSDELASIGDSLQSIDTSALDDITREARSVAVLDTDNTEDEVVYYTASSEESENRPFLVGTSPARQITDTTAIVQGYLNPGGYETRYEFRYGSTPNLGRQTMQRVRVGNSEAGLVSVLVDNLQPATRYYVQLCAENVLMEKCGVVTPFVTMPSGYVASSESNTETTPRQSTNETGATNDTSVGENSDEESAPEEENAEVAGSMPVSLEFIEVLVPVPSTFVELGIQNGVSAMQTGDILTYEVQYHNTSERNLRDGVLYIELPKELTYLDTTRGNYSTVDHAISYDFGIIGVDEVGTIFITMQVPELEYEEVPVIAMARLVHTNPDNGAREGATAYDADTRYHNLAERAPENLAALSVGAFGVGGSLIISLLLILTIMLGVYYMQMVGYFQPTKTVYKYVTVPVEQNEPSFTQLQANKPVRQAVSPEPKQKPALVDDVYTDQIYQGHLGV